jgi:chromosomal replication initiation ATPase DnaA
MTVLQPGASIYAVTHMALERRKASKHLLPADKIQEIIELVSEIFAIKTSDLIGPRRFRKWTIIRHLAMYVCCRRVSCPLQIIADHFGGRDHTTVIHARESINGFLQVSDAGFMELWNQFKQQAPEYLIPQT